MDSQTTQPVPTVRPISWLATIPQLLALSGAVMIGWFTTQSSTGVFWGAAVYLIYSSGSRTLILSAHRRGIQLAQAQQFEEAICAHKESYEFFSRHSRLDRYRSVTMMSPSAVSYREMALINIAFAYGQVGNGQKAKEHYQLALEQFPDSGMASAALKMIESVERSQAESENSK